MLDDVRGWLETNQGPWAYVVLGLASLIEYVFPPFPGDAVALFGIFLAVTAGYSGPLTFLALNVGATLGGLGAYGFGRAFADPERRPGFLKGERASKALATLAERYREHGGLYLLSNRFLPALRAFFFVAAGIAKIPVWQVMVYGGLSAMLWNALLFVLGWLAGESFDRLEGWVGYYAIGALSLAAVIAAVMFWRSRRKPASAR